MKIIASILMKAGVRERSIHTGYEARINAGAGTTDTRFQLLGATQLPPGKKGEAEILIRQPKQFGDVKPDMTFVIVEGMREVGAGTIISVRKK